jgi:hypothetical protein
MAHADVLRDMTVARRRALVASLLVGLPCVAWLVLAPLSTLVAHRSSVLLFVAVAAAAILNAVVFVELLRSVVPSLACWTERRHFGWVAFVFLILFSFQYAGLRITLSTHAL